MKVIYISHTRELQGAAKALINIVDGIRSLGVLPIVVLPGGGPQFEELNNLGVKIYTINSCQEIYPSLKNIGDVLLWPFRRILSISINFIAVCKFAWIVSNEKPDIVHSNTGVIRYGEFVSRLLGIPHVWHIREYQTKDFNWKPIGGIKRLKKLYSYKNNHCIAITKGIFDFFNLTIKDRVVYDGVFHENVVLPHTRQSNYFLYVGSISYGKGILDALDAFNQFAGSYKDYNLLIAGRGGLDIQKEIFKSPYANRIQYLGQRSDIYELMAGAIALLVPSYNEGFGFITTEAMLNKCIVIGRDTAGTKEQFDNGRIIVGREIGLRFLSKDQFVECMRKVVLECDSLLLREMKEDASFAVRRLYSIENNVNTIYNYYCSIL